MGGTRVGAGRRRGQALACIRCKQDVIRVLDQLIQEGEAVKPIALKKGNHSWLSGEEYEKWIAKCILYMEDEHLTSYLKDKFIGAAQNAVGNGESYFDTMMAILKAIKEYEAESLKKRSLGWAF